MRALSSAAAFSVKVNATMPGRVRSLEEEADHAAGQNLGLARAGAGQDLEALGGVVHRLLLEGGEGSHRLGPARAAGSSRGRVSVVMG